MVEEYRTRCEVAVVDGEVASRAPMPVWVTLASRNFLCSASNILSNMAKNFHRPCFPSHCPFVQVDR